MRTVHAIYSLIFACLLFLPGAGTAAKQDAAKRFAIVVGSDSGGPDRVKLRYAVSDARSVMDVLLKIGGVDRDSGLLVIEPDRERFAASMDDLNKRILAAKKKYARVELIFYYSGHSDEEGILLGGEKISYRDIKRAVVDVPADIRIAILDSCSSGAFTRLKGGKTRSPFMVDASRAMKGFAFMTSSSSDEASQESDRIRGSFFTHYLLTGLRGAADLAGDGRITLNEAYQFTYAETLAHTEKTLRGPQHPNYHIMMSGAGDVVLTDIRKSPNTLVLARTISGRIFLRDRDKSLVAELNKPKGRAVSLGLENGRYTVLNDRDGKLYEAKITLADGKTCTLNYNNFAVVDREQTRARGSEEPEHGDTRARPGTSDDSYAGTVKSGGFIDSKIRLAIHGSVGIIQDGVARKEKRYFNAMKPDLTAAYMNYKNYSIGTTFFNFGPEIEGLFPSIKFVRKRKFNLTGLKFGIRARYGYDMFFETIANSGSSGNETEGRRFMGYFLKYHYWSAGPTINIILSPRTDMFDLILNMYVTGGQAFGGRISAGSAMRNASLLWLRQAGFYGTPFLGLGPELLLMQSGRFNKTRASGFTIRGGLGPEISLNKRLPLIVGMHVTCAYTNLTFSRSLPVYFDRNRKSAHYELGGELSLGIHF